MSMSITLGNYQFRIVGRTTVIPNAKATSEVHGRDRPDNTYEVIYIQTFTLDGKPVPRISRNELLNNTPLIFGVYMSQSQMGFCRLANFHPIKVFEKGIDYAQTTLINFKLGQFIISNMLDPSIKEYNPYTEYDPDANNIMREPNVTDKARIAQIDNFGYPVPPQKCAEIKTGIHEYLQTTSDAIKTKFPTLVVLEEICPHSYSTSFAVVNGTVFKIILQSADAPHQQIEIYLYKYTITLNVNSETVNGTIPVLMKKHIPTDPEDITPVGTYGNYIPSFGAYVCKLFEYKRQLPVELRDVMPEVSDDYVFIGSLYNGLYPSEYLHAFLQQKSGASKKSHRRHSRIGRQRRMYHKRNTNKNINYKLRNNKRKRTFKRRK